jgi:mannose-6-phosphate isomerase
MSAHDESQRPWGRYEILQESAIHKTKCIYVQAGMRLSYQRHQKRAEHWFIVQGSAEVTLEGKVSQLSSGDTISIGIGQLHRIANIGNTEVIFIEVQTGTYFGEDDIERIEDDFGR